MLINPKYKCEECNCECDIKIYRPNGLGCDIFEFIGYKPKGWVEQFDDKTEQYQHWCPSCAAKLNKK